MCIYPKTLTERLEKKLDSNYTKMLRAILNKSWRQHPTKYQLYGHLPPITKTIQVRWTRHAGHCWRSWDELISDELLWTPSYGRAKAGRPARTYIQQLCEDTGCSPEDLPEVMNDWEERRERVRNPCWLHDMMMMMMIYPTSLCKEGCHMSLILCLAQQLCLLVMESVTWVQIQDEAMFHFALTLFG